MLGTLGIDASVLVGGKGTSQAIAAVQAGTPVILNFPNHYLVADDYNPDTGQFHVGVTASNALRGGQDWMTLDQIAGLAGAGGALRSVVIPQGTPNPPDSSAPSSGAIAPRADASPNPPDTTSLDAVQTDPTNRHSFVQSLQPLADYWSQQTGIPASVYLAAAASESNWGNAPGNELFGIKAHGTNKSQMLATHEVGPGGSYNTDQSFSAYDSPNQAFADFSQLVTNGRYAPAYQQLQKDGDARAFLQNVTRAGYATDQGWGDMISSLAQNTIAPMLGAPTDQSALAPNTNTYHGQMQGADGQPMSQLSSPFGGTDQTSQVDPNLPSTESRGVPPNPMTSLEGQAPASQSPLDLMPPGMAQPQGVLNAGQTAASLPGRLATGQNVWTGGAAEPVLSQQQAESLVIDPHNRMTPVEREQAARQIMDQYQSAAMMLGSGPSDLQATGGAGQAARAAEGADPVLQRIAQSDRNDFTKALDSQLYRDLGTHPQRYSDPPAPHLDPQTNELYDVTKNRFGNFEEVPGSRRPLDYVYRAVSDGELQSIRRTGVIQSDGRMNIVDTEGTVAAKEPAPFYLPHDQPGHILKIRVEPTDGWRVDSDSYIKTNQPIPADRIEGVSSFGPGHEPLGAQPPPASGLSNALSGKAGGLAPVRQGVQLGAGAVTGAIGYNADPNASESEKIRNAAIGGAAGYLGARGLMGAADRLTGAGAVRSSGVPGIDALGESWAAQSAKPNTIQRLASQISDLPKTLETGLLDANARANATTTAARKAMGVTNPLRTPPQIDAEAKLAAFADRASSGAQRLATGLGPIGEHVQSPEDFRNLNAMLKLQRDVEVGSLRMARGADPAELQFSNGVTSLQDAKDRLAQLEQAVGPATWQTYQDAAAVYHSHLNDLLDSKVKVGLLSQDAADWLKANHPNYSPSLLADAEGAQSVLAGKNLRVTGTGIKRLSELGHTAEDLPPLQAAAVLTLRENNRILRNDNVATLVRALQADPAFAAQVKIEPAVKLVQGVDTTTGDATKVAARYSPFELANIPGKVSFWQDGTPVLASVPKWAEDLVKGMTVSPDKGQAVKQIAHWLNSASRTAITGRNPIFPVVNGQADAVVALAQGLRPDQIAAAYPAVVRNSPEFQRFVALGGGRGGWHLGATDLAKIESAIRTSNGFLVRSPADIGNALKSIATLGVVEKYGNVVEMAPRLAAYRQALAQGATEERAVLGGRRVTLDFGRAGTWVRDANAYTLFLNAGVQGVAQLGRIARDHPKSVGLFVAGINAAVLGAYQWNQQFTRPSDGKPYIDDVPEYIRQTNLVLIAPQTEYTDAQGKERVYYVALPLRQMAALATPAMIAVQQWDQEDPKGFATEMARFGLRALSPVQGDSALGAIGQMLPAGLSTLFELGTNTDFYRGRDIVPKGLQDLPADRQINPPSSSNATPPLATEIANTKLPLVDKSLSDIGLSPIKAQYAAQDVGAGLGQVASGVGTLAYDTATGQDSSGAQDQLYQATAGRVLRNRAGGIEQAKGQSFDASLAETQSRAYEALQQTPGWSSLSTDEQNRRIRQVQNGVQRALVDSLGTDAPQYLQPEATPADGHPAKYHLEAIPPEIRSRYTGPNALFTLETDVTAAQKRIADARTLHQKPARADLLLAAVGRSTPTRAWQLWAKANRITNVQQRASTRQIIEQTFAPASP